MDVALERGDLVHFRGVWFDPQVCSCADVFSDEEDIVACEAELSRM